MNGEPAGSLAPDHPPGTLEPGPSAAPGGVVFDVQRGALHDGPGLRTVVFLKGCPLRCAWCHNPESQDPGPERGASGKVYGREMTVAEVMAVVRADRVFYDISGGGLTVSGGEPTVQIGFCLALLRAAKAEGIHTCLDTCGQFPAANLAELLPLVDLWHWDYKATGEAEHRRWTGVGDRTIKANLRALLDAGAAVRLRCPVVGGANATPEHLAALDALEADGRFEGVERLPNHATGNAKYRDLGRPVPVFAG